MLSIKLSLISLCQLLFFGSLYAQHPSSIMDLDSPDQGVLIPRTDTAAVNASFSPAKGLMIYQTTDNLFYYYNGTKWLAVGAPDGDNDPTNELDNTDNQVLSLNVNSLELTSDDGTDMVDLSAYIDNTDDQSLSEVLSEGNSAGNVAIIDLADPTNAQDAATKNYVDSSVPSGTQPGEMQYWNGASWVTLEPGNTGQMLTFCSGTPMWTSDGTCYPAGTVFCSAALTAIIDVTNSTTGKIWMDRNLGATQVATSSTDAASYGDKYQWGRGADGHQCLSSTTTSTLSSIDQPGHADFITVSGGDFDWRSPQNPNLWQGVDGTNNPCPLLYRLPTEAELDAERTSWSGNNAAGAFASPLKLPVTGYRSYGDGTLFFVGSEGYYWSSTVLGIYSRCQFFSGSNANMSLCSRAFGLSVRCIKE